MATANYEATVATGLEHIALDEVREKLKVISATQKGRIWFSSDAPVEKILELKSINNVFVILHSEKLDDDAIPKDTDSLESLLMKVGDKCDWNLGIEKWLEVSKFKSDKQFILTKDENLKDEQPKFRVSSNRYGTEHKFTSPEICSIFGHVIDTKFGWPIKMKEYDIQVMANFNENHLYVGLTLTSVNLDRRNIIDSGYTTLRATTCYAMCRIAKIQPGDIVVDPMAGSGAIPVECCSCWLDEWSAFTIAGEIGSTPLRKCKNNLAIFQDKPPYDMLQMDVTSLPFRDNSIDVFVSDLPFGKRHGSKSNNKTLYPSLLREMARTSRRGSARAILLTQDYKSMGIATNKNRGYWYQKVSTFVKVGNLNCHIYILLRTNKDFPSQIVDNPKI